MEFGINTKPHLPPSVPFCVHRNTDESNNQTVRLFLLQGRHRIGIPFRVETIMNIGSANRSCADGESRKKQKTGSDSPLPVQESRANQAASSSNASGKFYVVCFIGSRAGVVVFWAHSYHRCCFGILHLQVIPVRSVQRTHRALQCPPRIIPYRYRHRRQDLV
jgi:hypothetical protein